MNSNHDVKITCPQCSHQFEPMESFEKKMREHLAKEQRNLHQKMKEKEAFLKNQIEQKAREAYSLEANDLKKRLKEQEMVIHSSKKLNWNFGKE